MTFDLTSYLLGMVAGGIITIVASLAGLWSSNQ